VTTDRGQEYDMEFLQTALAHPMVRGALTGAGAAFIVDVQIWARTKDTDPAFNWRTASKRWIAGAITGSGLGAGLGAIS
jgi:hypothetical protein